MKLFYYIYRVLPTLDWALLFGMSLPGISRGNSCETHHLLYSPEKESFESSHDKDLDRKYHHSSFSSQSHQRKDDSTSQIDKKTESVADSKHSHKASRQHHTPRHLEIQTDISAHKYDQSIMFSEKQVSGRVPCSEPPPLSHGCGDMLLPPSSGSSNHAPQLLEPTKSLSEAKNRGHAIKSHHHIPRHLEVQADISSHKYDHSIMMTDKCAATYPADVTTAGVGSAPLKAALDVNSSHVHPLPPLNHHCSHNADNNAPGPREAAYHHLLVASQETIASEHTHKGTVPPLARDQNQSHLSPPKHHDKHLEMSSETHKGSPTHIHDCKDDFKNGEEDDCGGQVDNATNLHQHPGADAKNSGTSIPHAGELSAFRARSPSCSPSKLATGSKKQYKNT